MVDLAGGVVPPAGAEGPMPAGSHTGRSHILFVDDEPAVLNALRRMLHPHRQRWDLSFTTSGDQALDILATRPCRLVVTDFRMPGMDGGQLLAEVRDRYPSAARVILSGHTGEINADAITHLAHHFLTKPCKVDALISCIETLT